jgi:high-affinity iron transporter
MYPDNIRGGATSKLQYFLVVSTCLLYLVAAGLFSRAVWFFEAQQWNNAVGTDAEELGSGPGSYDITKSVWHVNVSSNLCFMDDSLLICKSSEIQY